MFSSSWGSGRKNISFTLLWKYWQLNLEHRNPKYHLGQFASFFTVEFILQEVIVNPVVLPEKEERIDSCKSVMEATSAKSTPRSSRQSAEEIGSGSAGKAAQAAGLREINFQKPFLLPWCRWEHLADFHQEGENDTLGAYVCLVTVKKVRPFWSIS